MSLDNVAIFDHDLIEISKKTLRIDEVLQSQYMIDERLIKVVVEGQGAVPALSFGDVAKNLDKCIKVEGIEKLNRRVYRSCLNLQKIFGHDGPVTCHLFIAPQGSLSFPEHTDPDDVIVHVVEGEKTMSVWDESYELRAGSSLFIPHNTPHQAFNHKASIMLSFGLERFLIEKLDL